MAGDSGALTPYVPRIVLGDLLGAPTPEGGWSGPDPPHAVLEGSVVFVDISGFTKLSERLARKGREGAEHLADAIGQTFETLLEVAYDNGGGLLKFGGDALLLLFSDDDHAVRACRSAIGMRRALRASGHIHAGDVEVALRMSVGVHSGQFHLFLAGGSHREFIITGPGATAVVAMEAAAAAGEIVLSPATAALIGARCTGAARGPGVLLRSEPPPVAVTPAPKPVEVDPEAARQFLSTALLRHVQDVGQSHEHRIVTISFVHFDGTDALIASEGPQACAAALDELVRAVQDAVDEQGICFLGSDVDADGGKLILTSGAPRTLEDDEQRMLLALRRIIGAPTRLGVRAGVNRGPVFAGDIGPHYRKTYTVMGDAVNLAARLMAKAPPGEAYATVDVLDRSLTRFATTELEPFSVKGKSRPVQAWSVGAAIGGRVRDDGIAVNVGLIGREQEMAVLERSLERARAGEGQLVEIVGEPGIGKSRLTAEVRSRASGMRALHSTCEAYTANFPYAAWYGILRELVGLRLDDPDDVVLATLRRLAGDDPELAPWVELIAIPFDVEAHTTAEVAGLAPEFRQAKLHETLVRFLAPQLAQPTLVEIENTQLMDRASADLLESMLHSLDGVPWLFVVTRRDMDSGFVGPDLESVQRVEPAPLSLESGFALAEAMTEASPLPERLVRLAVERSGGSPQFLRDLLRATVQGEQALPDSIEAAATARIDRLAARDRTLVRRASVLGIGFNLHHLAWVLEDEAPLPDDRTWERLAAYFVREDAEHVRFRRGIVREVAYTGLPFRVRRRLHRVVGEALEAEVAVPDESSGTLSLHFFMAGDYERCWRYARSAADRARDRFAHADAARLYQRAIEAGRRLQVVPDVLADVYEALGEARATSGEPDAAMAAFTAARRLVHGDRVREARLLHRHGEVAMHAGRVGPATRWLNRGLRTLDGLGPADVARVRAPLLSTLGSVRQRQKRALEAIELCQQAIVDAEAADDDSALAHASYVLDWALWEAGRPDEAVHSPRALEIYRRLGRMDLEAVVLGNMGMFAYYAGRWDLAIDLYGRASEASLRAGNDQDAAYGVVNAGEVLSDQGRIEEAEVELRRARRSWRRSANHGGAAFATTLLGRVAARGGRFDDAHALLREGAEGFRSVQMVAEAAFADALGAEALVLEGRGAEALLAADTLLERVGHDGRLAPLLLRVRGIALAGLGDTAGALAALQRSEEIARRRGDDFELLLTLSAIAADGRDADRAGERDDLVERLQIVALHLLTTGARRDAPAATTAQPRP